MALTQDIGTPWIHQGWDCSDCLSGPPLSGHVYMSLTEYNYGYCSKCRTKKQEDDGVVKLGLYQGSRPYQIHCIDCDKCGVSPIEGPRYQHKEKQNFSLCAPCFIEATSVRKRLAESPNDYSLVEHTEVRCSYKTHQPVFHFGVNCNECAVFPICGPRYKATLKDDYDLCLLCFDSMLTKKKIDGPAFQRVAQPEASRAVHVIIYSCHTCGVTPICGPAYISQKTEDKIVCLLCYLNKSREKQATYTRQEPPLMWSDDMGPGKDVEEEGIAVEEDEAGQASSQSVTTGSQEVLLMLQQTQNIQNQMWLARQHASMTMNIGSALSNLAG